LIPLDEAQVKELRKARLIAVALLFIAPAIYLAIALIWLPANEPIAAESNLVFYILVIVGASQPLLLPVIERVQIKNFRQQTNRTMSALQLYLITTITRLAVVETVFIFGLVVFMLSGSTVRMLIFYAIGICWSFVNWPREDKMRNFLQRSEMR